MTRPRVSSDWLICPASFLRSPCVRGGGRCQPQAQRRCGMGRGVGGGEGGGGGTMAPERPTHSDPARSTRFRVPVLISSSSSTVFSFMKILRVKMEWLLRRRREGIKERRTTSSACVVSSHLDDCLLQRVSAVLRCLLVPSSMVKMSFAVLTGRSSTP